MIVADPAHCAFDCPVITEVQLDSVPYQRFERAGHHRAAAGEIDELDLEVLAVVGEPGVLSG
jgi:hypothetical protein